eukprot:m.33154 g.33154  ORF g.33154 m.33154 type:complete len:516 (+) comp31764_c0_seq8:85-1632(+)
MGAARKVAEYLLILASLTLSISILITLNQADGFSATECIFEDESTCQMATATACVSVVFLLFVMATTSLYDHEENPRRHFLTFGLLKLAMMGLWYMSAMLMIINWPLEDTSNVSESLVDSDSFYDDVKKTFCFSHVSSLIWVFLSLIAYKSRQEFRDLPIKRLILSAIVLISWMTLTYIIVIFGYSEVTDSSKPALICQFASNDSDCGYYTKFTASGSILYAVKFAIFFWNAKAFFKASFALHVTSTVAFLFLGISLAQHSNNSNVNRISEIVACIFAMLGFAASAISTTLDIGPYFVKPLAQLGLCCPSKPSESDECEFVCVPLDKNSLDYSILANMLLPHQVIIIEQITYKNLLHPFSKEWKRMKRRRRRELRQGRAIESLQLFHGTNLENACLIMRHGFKKELAGMQDGAQFGNGVYFTAKPETALEYSRQDPESGEKVLLYCTVLIGMYTPGDADMDMPPLIPGYSEESGPENCLYDSTVDNAQQPTIFVSCYKGSFSAVPTHVIKVKNVN